MNTCYNHNSDFNSNKRIIEAYFGEAVKPVGKGKRILDTLLSFVSLMIRALTSSLARRLLKAFSVAVCLIGFVGVIGAMESGAIGLGTGLLIGLGLMGIEYLSLRPAKKAVKGK